MSNTKKMSKPLIIAVAAAVAVVVIIIAAVAGGAKTVDLADYTEIKVDGYNGYATAKVDFEYSDLEEFIFYGSEGEKDIDEMDDEDFESRWARYELLEEALDSVEYEMNKKEEISNGDKLEVTFTWSEESEKLLKDEFKVKLDAGKVELTVDGLEEAKVIDPFEYIEVDFKGVTGFAEIDVHTLENLNIQKDGYIITGAQYDNDEIIIKYTESKTASIDFTVSKLIKLSNGEKITIYAEAERLEDGMALARTEKEYIVKAAEAIKTKEELQSNFDEIVAYCTEQTLYNNVYATDDYFFVTRKTEDADYDNMVVMVYKRDGYLGSDDYYVFIAKNCYIDSEGNIAAHFVSEHALYVNTAAEALAAAEAEIDTSYYTYEKG